MIGHGLIRAKTATFRQLSSMISGGVSLSEALQVVARRAGHPKLRDSLQKAAEATAKGERLSQVLGGYPDLYPPLTLAMVQAAERSGRLHEIFRRLADYHEREYQMRLMLSRETFYAKVLILAIVFIPLGGNALKIWVVTGLGAAVAYFVKRLLLYGAIAALPALGIWMVWRALRSSEAGSAGIDEFKLRVPLVGKVVRLSALARFARSLATLYAAGVSMSEAVQLAGDATANARLREQAYRAADLVKTGTGITEALKQTGLSDELTLSMLRTGEQTGNLDETMDHLAQYYEDESITAARQMAVAIVPIVVIIAGIIVAFMLLQFYTGYAANVLAE